MAVIISKQLTVPVVTTGKLLSDFAQGDIVKLNESGNPVEFYVACHDYESDLNGVGKTLLVRKDCHSTRQWHNTYTSNYSTCDLNTWLNGTYKSLHDTEVQNIMGTTIEIMYSGSLWQKTTMNCSVFILSHTEYGSNHYSDDDGVTLPIYSTLLNAYLNGSSVAHWTRTPIKSSNNGAVAIDVGGKDNGQGYNANTSLGVRPALTLPSTSLFDHRTNIFKGV